MARRAGDREAGNVRQMASDCVQAVLAMDVTQAGPPGFAEEYPCADSPDNGKNIRTNVTWAVTETKKSQATIAFAWLQTKVLQC